MGIPTNLFWVEVAGIKETQGSMIRVYYEIFLGLIICVYAIKTKPASSFQNEAPDDLPAQVPKSNLSKVVVAFIKSDPLTPSSIRRT